MDIESKGFRLKTTGIPGQIEVRDKKTQRSEYVSPADLPSVHSLAMMHENAFNRLCRELVA